MASYCYFTEFGFDLNKKLTWLTFKNFYLSQKSDKF